MFDPSCQTGGALWFENLAAVDVTFVLPTLSALSWIWTFRVGCMYVCVHAQFTSRKFMSNSIRTIHVFSTERKCNVMQRNAT